MKSGQDQKVAEENEKMKKTAESKPQAKPGSRAYARGFGKYKQRGTLLQGGKEPDSAARTQEEPIDDANIVDLSPQNNKIETSPEIPEAVNPLGRLEKLSLRFNSEKTPNDTLLTILTQDCRISAISLDYFLLLIQQNAVTKQLNQVQKATKYEHHPITTEIHPRKLITAHGQVLEGVAKMVQGKYVVLDSTPYIYELESEVTTLGKWSVNHRLKLLNPLPAYHSSYGFAEPCSLNITLNKASKIKALQLRKRNAVEGIFVLGAGDRSLKFVQIGSESQINRELTIPESVQGNIKRIIPSNGHEALIIETHDHDIYIGNNVNVDERIHTLRKTRRQ